MPDTLGGPFGYEVEVWIERLSVWSREGTFATVEDARARVFELARTGATRTRVVASRVIYEGRGK